RKQALTPRPTASRLAVRATRRGVARDPAPTAGAPAVGAARTAAALSVGAALCAAAGRARQPGVAPLAAGGTAGRLAGSAAVGPWSAARLRRRARGLAAALQQWAGGRTSHPPQAPQTPDVRARQTAAVTLPLPAP